MSSTFTDPALTPTIITEPRKTLSKQNLAFPDQVWAFLACFRSIQLAIVLLSLLALAIMAGVLLPQEGLVDTIQMKHQFGSNYHLMKSMGFFSVYSSYWFISLEVLFFFNLLIGSFKWLKPAFLAATRKTFCGPEHILASPHRLLFEKGTVDNAGTNIKGQALANILALLKKHHYRIYKGPINKGADAPVLLYATKGNFSRLGPVVAHLGILLMLISSVYGVFFGFKAQELAAPGQTFSMANTQMFRPNADPSIWLGSIPPWKVRVNDFHMEYYKNAQANDPSSASGMTPVKQYWADLSILDNQGKTLHRQIISVNHPLAMGDTTFYQASFSPTGKIFVRINGQDKTLNTNTKLMNRPVSMSELGNNRTLVVFPFFIQQDANVTRNTIVLFLRDGHGFIGAKPGQMPPNLRLTEGQSGDLSGIHFQYVKPEIATGLQIKKGPEVPWMYLSYLIIIVGAVMCIFSHRQLWVAVSSGTKEDSGPKDASALQEQEEIISRLMLMFKTKKARLSFMKELQQLQTKLYGMGFEPWSGI